MEKYFSEKSSIYIESDDSRYDKKTTSIIISFDFALFLKVGDVIIFSDEPEEIPKWVLETDENFKELSDFAIIIKERVIYENSLKFNAVYL